MHWLWLGLLSLMVLFLFLFISLSLSLWYLATIAGCYSQVVASSFSCSVFFVTGVGVLSAVTSMYVDRL